VSAHVAPDRWADLAAGRVDAATRATMDAHAAGCARCRDERARVEAVRTSFDAIRRGTPALGVESQAARSHWIISSELKRREREAERSGERARHPGRRWWPTVLVSAGVLAAAGIGLFAWTRGGRGNLADAQPSAPVAVVDSTPEVLPRTPVVPPPSLATPPGDAGVSVAGTPLEGLITLAEGQVLLDGAPLSPDAVLHAGNRLTTGAGRVHVQFGDASGLVLEPRSVLELTSFDSRSVELRVEGAVGVQVSHRAPEQTFAVVAAGRRVEVRGTIFRVAGGSHGLEVEVTRGRVAVTDNGSDAIEIPAGSWLQVPLAVSLAGLRARPMTDAALLAAAQRLRVSTLSVWPSRALAQASSSLLRVSASAGTLVSVDDVPVGKGTVVLRVPPGRHLVKTGASSRWVEVEPGVPAEAPLAPPAPSRRVSERARQVEDEAGRLHVRFEVCANRARSVDPAYTGELVVEIDIGSDGSLRSVVAVKGLPDQATEGCMLDVIRREFVFPPGSRDTVRKVLRFQP
jgi:ferric-dicitrate binding protein FerR (iron transport regulator)